MLSKISKTLSEVVHFSNENNTIKIEITKLKPLKTKQKTQNHNKNKNNKNLNHSLQRTYHMKPQNTTCIQTINLHK